MLFLIKRTDGHEYDEYDSVVVRAATSDEAIALIFKPTEERPYWGFAPDGSNFTCEPIDPGGEPGVILGSFNAS